jgi:hypothetical protein
VIDKWELNPWEDEHDVKVEHVFLEKAYKPSNSFGDGIPRRILVLTNRRLFFLLQE